MILRSLKGVLLVNAIVETGAGIVVVFSPALLMWGSAESPTYTSINLSKLYGIAAITIGIFSYLIYNFGESEKLIRFTALSIIGFHIAVGLHYYGLFVGSLNVHPGIFSTHLILAIIFTMVYLKNL